MYIVKYMRVTDNTLAVEELRILIEVNLKPLLDGGLIRYRILYSIYFVPIIFLEFLKYIEMKFDEI